jgi:MFS family permease
MLELVIGGYLIAFAVLLITGARLGQTHGYKRLFLIGMATFSLASLLCGLAPSPEFLVGARVVQGAGAALMFPQALTGIQLNFAGARRLRAVGLYAVALSTGAVIGQILGGVLISADLLGTQWRAVFLINVPIGIGAIVAAMRHLPADTARESRSIDLVGVATLSTSVLLLVLPLSVGRSEGWPTWTIVCLAAALPAFATFVVAQRHLARLGRSPLVNVDAIARRPVAWALATLLAATGTYYALLFTLAQYLQRGLGDSAVVSGLTLVPWVAAFGIAGQIVRRLPARMLGRAPTAGCLLLTLAYTGISAALFGDHHGELLLIVLLCLGGLGLGLQFSALITHLTSVVSTDYAPDISGVSTTTMQIGGAVGVAAFGTLYLSLTPTTALDATHAFAVTTAAYAAVALVASAMAQRATSRLP